jgi:hypothetical protein
MGISNDKIPKKRIRIKMRIIPYCMMKNMIKILIIPKLVAVGKKMY